MNVENFTFDKKQQNVSWFYQGEKIEKYYINLNEAFIKEKDKLIIVSVGENHNQDQIYYFSYDGNQVFFCNKINNKIGWDFMGLQSDINCENILTAKFFIEFKIICIITGTNLFDRRLLGYSLDGRRLFDSNPPDGFRFEYFTTTSKNQPAVICEGDKEHQDPFGRSTWHYIIDIETGELSKGSLAY